MAAFCIGGVCIPYTAIVPAVLIFFKWLAEQLGFWSLKKGGDTRGAEGGGTCGCGTAVATSASRILKPRRSKLGKSLSTISNASSGGRGIDGTVKEIGSTDEWQGTISSSNLRPVVVKFTAEWCKPCKSIDPFYHSMAKKYDATFVKIDVDELDDVAAAYSVAMMPTFVLLKSGRNLGAVSGAHEDKLEALVQEHCPARVPT